MLTSLLSPFEANELLPHIQLSEKCVLHLYAPRTSKTMVSFSQLNFYQTPSDLLICIDPHTLRWLDLFAGALYLDAFDDYRTVCEILGLIGSGKPLKPDAVVSSAGFVDRASRLKTGWLSVFEKSPIPFIKALLSMRCQGDNYQFTDVGLIVSGRVLSEDRF